MGLFQLSILKLIISNIKYPLNTVQESGSVLRVYIIKSYFQVCLFYSFPLPSSLPHALAHPQNDLSYFTERPGTTDTNSDISLRLNVAIEQQLFSVAFLLIQSSNKIKMYHSISKGNLATWALHFILFDLLKNSTTPDYLLIYLYIINIPFIMGHFYQHRKGNNAYFSIVTNI